MVQAIKAGKFIDLSDLLPEALREMQFDDSKDTKSKEEGKKRKYVINTPLDWSVAYAIFMAVSAHFDPSRAFALSAYASIVLSLARDIGGQAWLQYDKVFRQSAAVNPSLPWHRREQDVWLMAAASAQGSMRPVSRSPSQGGAPPPQQGRWNSSDPCRRWNEGRCTLPWCKFRHVCSLCQGAHRALRCYRYASTSNSTPAAAEPQAGKGNSTTKE